VPKVLAQAGQSLADLYGVAGSIAGVDELESRVVVLFHEMGDVLFSERVAALMQRGTTGNILQTVDYNITFGGHPNTPTRILGCTVTADADRILTHQVSVRDNVLNTETPFFVFDGVNDPVERIRYDPGTGTIGDHFLLQPGLNLLPTMMMRVGEGDIVPNIVVRGTSTTFGAGNVDVTTILHLARPLELAGTGAQSARGLPLPSW